jgi:hypothetical protein
MKENMGTNKKIKNIPINDLLKCFNISILDDTEIIDFLSDNGEAFNLDLFPFIIDDYQKYNQVEIFYQRYLDGDLTKQEFETNEQKYHQFIKTLWLYNDVYVQVAIDSIEFKERQNYINKTIKLKRNNEFLLQAAENFKIANLVDSLKNLDSLLLIATREISHVLFYFMDFKLIIGLFGCSAIIYFGDQSMYAEVLDIARHNQLYLLRCDNQ